MNNIMRVSLLNNWLKLAVPLMKEIQQIEETETKQITSAEP